MKANYGKPLRVWMREQSLEEIVDFGDLTVFETATTYPCIIRISNSSPRSNFNAAKVETLEFRDLENYL